MAERPSRLVRSHLSRLEPLEERTLLSLGCVGPDPMYVDGESDVQCQLIASSPTPPTGIEYEETLVTVTPQSAVMLSQVPTSTWTYGCSATSAGMIFGYYDRTGYSNMYAGASNGGVAPLTDLGQGIGSPIAGSCSIIATANGFDSRVTAGHVDDYWIGTGSAGPDPWESGGVEHTWGDCTADYMGTNQWKWDFRSNDGVIDFNRDGSTALFSNESGTPLYDYIPPASQGLPQTALCHGMRLFAESRGYSVATNYTQKTYNLYADGFTFADLQTEIDAGYPVMVQVEDHSMVGVGYDAASSTVFLHDTWDNLVHSMVWDSTPDYSGMGLEAVTVIHLDELDAELDYGDAPDPTYPTLAASNGAAHVIAGPWFGDSTDKPDADADGQPDASALGDDTDGNDDEDGIVVPPMLPGNSSAVTIEVSGVPVGGAAQIDAWIDFDGSGTWEASEHLNSGVSMTVGANGTIVVPFSVPSTAVVGSTFGRFRISTQGSLLPTGVASDGEVEDHEVTILEQPEGTKWIQWPDLSPNGIDVRVTSDASDPITLADDWECTEESLLTDVHLWGSWLHDEVGVIETVHLSIHSDDPVGTGGTNPDNQYSVPDQLLWEMDFDRTEVGLSAFYEAPNDGEYWWDPSTETLIADADNTVWQLDIDIDPLDAFRQTGSAEEPTIYWLDVSVTTTSGDFGWKTRQYPDHFMDDAVWQGSDPTVWKEMVYPTGHPYLVDGSSIDLAFMLTFQPAEDKWVQWPDTTTNGIDIKATTADDGTRIVLADDWECTEPSLLTDVHLWGSWLYDDVGVIENLHLSVHSDDPVGEGGSDPDNQYSMPDELLWEMDFTADEIVMSEYFVLADIGEYWWDPTDPDPGTALIPNADRTIWQVDVVIDPDNAFLQEGTPNNPTVYWLDVNVKTTQGTEFGWKTREYPEHYNDDAVWHHDGLATPYWNEMHYPQGHPYEDVVPNSIDMAFMLTFEALPNGLDWGDAPDSAAALGYPTLAVNNGANHVITGPWLGDDNDGPDSELDGQPVPAGLGDDQDGNDDEDGVLIPVLVQGQAAVVTFEVNGVAAGTAAWVDGWIDFDGSKTWDASELVVSGAYGDGTHSVAITTPSTATVGTTYARFRINTSGALAPTGSAADGEVEDHEVAIEEGDRNLDWGDAPDSVLAAGYPTLAVNNGARHYITGPWLGPGPVADNRDAEYDGQPDSSALGDDNAANDDENGMSFSVLIAGETGTLTIDVAGGGGIVNGWIDFNGDKVWDDTAGSVECVLGPGLTIAGGTYTLSFPVPADAVVGRTYARFRINSYGDLPPTGPAQDGEVEDYVVTILDEDTPLDLGDAPDGIGTYTYPTLKVSDGARHYPTGPTLGATRDTEGDGQPDLPATGDDLAGSDDEDGVLNSSTFSPGLKGAWVEVDASAASYLSVWIDYNGNGVWETSEKIGADVPLTAGMNLLPFDIPTTAVPGLTYARLRLTSYNTGGALAPTGLAYDGEVEDYLLEIDDVLHLYGTDDDDTVVVTTDGSNYTVTINGVSASYSAAVYSSIVFDADGGNDTLEIYDWTGDDILAVDPTQATMDWGSDGVDFTGFGFEVVRGFAPNGGTDEATLTGTTGSDKFYGQETLAYVQDAAGTNYHYSANGFEEVTGVGGGGDDTAYLYGSAGDDTLDMSVGAATMTRAGSSTTVANGFATVNGYAGAGGTDTATLTGTTATDLFTGKETYAYMRNVGGTDYFLYADKFSEVTAYANGGVDDVAYLYGSTGDETLDMSVGAATMARSGSSTTVANGFDTVNGYAVAGGADTATLTGTTATDLFTGKETYAYMRNVGGADYLLYAAGFDEVTGYGNGGTDDAAYLYGSTSDDTLDSSVGTATMTRSGSATSVANDFARVNGYAGAGGTDTATLTGTTGTDKFSASETSAYMQNVGGAAYFLYAAGFAEVTAYGNGGVDDVAYLYGSAGNDTLDLNVGASTMTRTGSTTSVANDFPSTYGYAGTSGTDTATLTGTTGADSFYGRETIAYTRNVGGADYFLYARDFGEVTAYGGGGTDTAYLWGSTSDDTLDVGVGLATMIRSGSTTTAAHAFADVYGFRVAGGTDTANLTGSTGNDVFYGRETYSILRDEASAAFYFYVDDFSTVEAFGHGGDDTAYLYGSTGDDTLDMTVGLSTMTRTGSTTSVANDFDSVNGYALAGGTDTATLTGTTGADLFSGRETFAYMRNEGGSDYFLYAASFDEVTAHSNGGADDRAYLYDSDGDDTVTFAQNDASAVLNPISSSTVNIDVYAFDRIYAYATNGGTDVADVAGTTGADTFTGRDDWGTLNDTAGTTYYNHVRYFDEVYAEAGDTVSGNDTLDVPESGGTWDVDYLFDPGDPLDW